MKGCCQIIRRIQCGNDRNILHQVLARIPETIVVVIIPYQTANRSFHYSARHIHRSCSICVCGRNIVPVSIACCISVWSDLEASANAFLCVKRTNDDDRRRVLRNAHTIVSFSVCSSRNCGARPCRSAGISRGNFFHLQMT